MTDPRSTPSIFTRGAVDLSALRAPTPPPRPVEQAPNGGPRPGGSTAAVIDVTEATFQSEVVERSLSAPVIMDFWADWCQPCKQLSPVLEKLAIEYAGAWTLAKVNVDTNPRLAQAFGVQGIPMVIAVAGGRPIDAFTGVVPEAQLRQWIDAILKAAGVGVEAPEDPRIVSADEALIAGDLDAAEQAYRKILAESPANDAAEAGLAHVELARRVQGVDPLAALAAAEERPEDIDAQLLAADVQVLTGEAEKAYGRLVDVVRRASGDDRDRVRKHLLSLFTVAGPDDPAVAAARRALASALY